MINKFQAIYRLTIYTKDNTLTIESPLTIKFNVTRGTISQASRATIQVYNLAPSSRNQIFQDVFVLPNAYNAENQKYIKLEAGYLSMGMATIFEGRILQAYSHRAGGSGDVITEIQASLLDIFDMQGSYLFETGTTFKEAYKIMAADMKNTIIGNTGDIEGTFKTPTSFDGNVLDNLNTLTGGHTFVDNGVLNTLLDNEAIDVPIALITDENGLLDTPIRRDAQLEVKMLFEPSLLVGQILEIRSKVSPVYNGQYKVLGFTHDCLISDSQAGKRTTTVYLWIGALLPSQVINLTDEEIKKAAFYLVKGEDVKEANVKEPNTVKEVYNYINKNNKVPATKMYENILWTDAIRQNIATYGKPTLKQLSNLYEICGVVQSFKNAIHPSKKLVVISGWRSQQYNSTIDGAAPLSKHIEGKAVDFYIEGVKPSQIRYGLVKWGFKGRKKEYPTFIHIDLEQSSTGYANDW